MTLTDDEFNALIAILSRAPINAAERIGLQAIIAKLQPKPPDAPEPPKP